jgi:tRNA(Ile2) C34 agmatinyltransferase TiaS
MATITLEEQIAAVLSGDQLNYASLFEATTETLTLAQKQIGEMRKFTGPKCPLCGHWLKAEHEECSYPDRTKFYVCEDRECASGCGITSTDLLANHPLIAAEMGLSAQ